MFEEGKVYKVKVETTPGVTSFGRATIVEKSGNQLLLQLKTSRDPGKTMPKGAKIWFVDDSQEHTFNGLWASSIIGTQHGGSKNLLVCSTPKLEPLLQRRRTPRVALDVPVRMTSSEGLDLGHEIRSKDISRSGIAIATPDTFSHPLEPGDILNLVVESSLGEIPVEARVIRSDTNWLAKKTLMGLEFSNVPEESVILLDKLLVLLGGKPRHQEAQEEAEALNQAKKEGLSGWMNDKGGRSKSEGSTRFVGTHLEADAADEDASNLSEE